MISLFLLSFVLLGLFNGYALADVSFINEKDLNPDLQVWTEYGTVQGTKEVHPEHRDYFAYYNMPYAIPPLGPLRFRAPKRARSWEGILDATKDGNECYQIKLRERIQIFYGGVEDCLYMTVYTPKNPRISKELLPVMVWIYGGAFMEGASNSSMYGPQYLMNEDIVLVTFNYRLNVFGFLSTQSKLLPGNYGIKDQILALKWVQRNIKNFGGNPNLVTIFGQSAGGASVHHHMRMPASKGLFHRVISQSGATTCEWSLQKYPNDFAEMIFMANGLLSGNEKLDLTKLRKIDAVGIAVGQVLPILQTNMMTIMKGRGNMLTTSPSYEPRSKEAVITQGQLDLKNLENGNFHKVPLMIGFTANELELFSSIVKAFKPFLGLFDLYPEFMVPAGLDLKDNEVKIEVGRKIHQYYFHGKTIVQSPRQWFYNFFNDMFWYRPIRKAAEIQSKFVPTYLYEFAYEGELAYTATGGAVTHIDPGAGHASDVFYLFKPVTSTSTKDDDFLMVKKMVKLWTNFAKYGNPTPQADPLLDNIIWPKVNPEDAGKGRINFVRINKTITVEHQKQEEIIKFWDEIFKNYSTNVEHTSF